jgi:hypothetical protein
MAGGTAPVAVAGFGLEELAPEPSRIPELATSCAASTVWITLEMLLALIRVDNRRNAAFAGAKSGRGPAT